MECNLGRNHTRDFKMEWVHSASSIWNHKYDFKPKLHEMRLDYHFITSILKSHKYRLGQFKYFIDAVLSRSEIKFIHFLGGESKTFGNESCKICHMILFVFYFSAIWSVTLNKPWNMIVCFVFSVASSLVGKRCDLKQKMVRFVNKSHQLEPIRLQGPPVISK